MKSLPKHIRIFGLIVVDAVAILACYFLALLLRFNFDVENQYLELFVNSSVAIVVIKLLVFYFFDLYKSVC